MKKKCEEVAHRYPIYFKSNIYTCCCLLNGKEAIYIELYEFSTSIQYHAMSGGTWVHDVWNDGRTKTSKSEYKKALKRARKILQEKLKL